MNGPLVLLCVEERMCKDVCIFWVLCHDKRGESRVSDKIKARKTQSNEKERTWLQSEELVGVEDGSVKRKLLECRVCQEPNLGALHRDLLSPAGTVD